MGEEFVVVLRGGAGLGEIPFIALAAAAGSGGGVRVVIALARADDGGGLLVLVPVSIWTAAAAKWLPEALSSSTSLLESTAMAS